MLGKALPSALCICLTTLLSAQQVTPPAEQSIEDPAHSTVTSETISSSGTVIIPADTMVLLRLDQTVSSANALAGEKIQFTLINDLVADNHVVARAGTPCYATIKQVLPMNAKHNGHFDFSDSELDLGHGQRIHFTKKSARSRKNERGDRVGWLIFALVVSPVEVPMLPIQLIYALKDHKHRIESADLVDEEIPQGERFNYYVRHAMRAHMDQLVLPRALETSTPDLNKNSAKTEFTDSNPPNAAVRPE